jgi:hypothetical protein
MGQQAKWTLFLLNAKMIVHSLDNVSQTKRGGPSQHVELSNFITPTIVES